MTTGNQEDSETPRIINTNARGVFDIIYGKRAGYKPGKLWGKADKLEQTLTPPKNWRWKQPIDKIWEPLWTSQDKHWKESHTENSKPVVKREVTANKMPVQPSEGVKHPLEHTWCIWLYREVSKNWQQNLVEMAPFSTVEDYWCLFHHIKLPSELEEGQQYNVFKQGVKPTWEDPVNRKGGRWLITIDKRTCHEVDRIWSDLILMMIGENFEEANSAICGAVANAKAKNNKSKLGIWVRNKTEESSIMKIGKIIKKVLGLQFKITFQAHNSNSTMYSA